MFVGGSLVFSGAVVLEIVVEAESLVGVHSSGTGLLIIEGGVTKSEGAPHHSAGGLRCLCAFQRTSSRRLFPVKEQKYLVASAKAQKRRNACCWSSQTWAASTAAVWEKAKLMLVHARSLGTLPV